VSEDEVRELLRAKIREAGSLRKLAQTMRVTPSYISQVTNGIQAPGGKILGWLGLDREISYKRIEESNA